MRTRVSIESTSMRSMTSWMSRSCARIRLSSAAPAWRAVAVKTRAPRMRLLMCISGLSISPKYKIVRVMSTEKQGYVLQGVKWGPDFRGYAAQGVRWGPDFGGYAAQGVRWGPDFGGYAAQGVRWGPDFGGYAAQGLRWGPDFGGTLEMQISCVKGLFFAY